MYNKLNQLRKLRNVFLLMWFIPLTFWGNGCKPPPPEPTQSTVIEDAEMFLAINNLGSSTISSFEFQQFLDKIPQEYAGNRLFLVRIDELPLGNPYSGLDQWDLALENGMIKGLLTTNYKIAEKLDFVAPRDPGEFIGTSPDEGFYMHGIDLEDHNKIKQDYKAPLLLEYQVIEFSEQDNSVIVYFRMVDLDSLLILSSTVVKVGDFVDRLSEVDIKEYDRTYTAIVNSDLLESDLLSSLHRVAILDMDILNISGGYKTAPSKKLLAIENGLISGIINHVAYNEKNPFLKEKSTGFKLKFPAVYKNIVFNTNPILYEEWSEFTEATGCTELILYRYLKDEGLYLRFVDAAKNGEIFFSNVIPFNDTEDIGVFKNHNSVAEKFGSTFSFDLLSGKKLMILDGDKHPVESENYAAIRNRFGKMHFAIEEGFITSMLRQSEAYSFTLYEKLKTLYLKRPWMYDTKVFNLNPLYLDDWKQLQSFGVEMLLVYNNLIPYEDLTPDIEEYTTVAMSYRLIDLITGDVVFSNQFSNLVGEISNLDDADSDGDGVGDNGDLYPDDPNESADSDGDGVDDNADAFPDDPSKWE